MNQSQDAPLCRTDRAERVPPVRDLDSAVRALLTQARAAHLQKKHCAGKANKQGIVTSPPNYAEAERHIRDAIRLREEAHALDPDHLSPAWAEDQVANRGQSHEALMQWFRRYLATP